MRKRLVLMFSVCALLFFKANTQVYTGDLMLNTQAQVDGFNFTSVTGSLRVLSTNISNLNGLSELTTVGEDFYIAGTSVVNVDALSNLASVGDLFTINNNRFLTNVDGLYNLADVGGFLSIGDNPVLSNLNGLTGLTSIGSLSLSDNDLLNNINGLSNLTVSVIRFLTIENNNALTDLNGLGSIKTVTIHLTISSNFALTDLSGLSNLETVFGDLTMVSSRFANLDGLSSLTKVGDSLILTNDSLLTNIDGLSGLEDIDGGLKITDNNVLANINGLSNLTSLGGLVLEDNALITNIDALSKLESIDGRVDISGNPALTNVDGFANLEEVDGSFGIVFNPNLTSVDGLSKLKRVGGHFSLSFNPKLANIDGLSSLTTVGMNFGIGGNTLITNLDALPKLNYVGLDLGISNNPALIDFCGLYNLFHSGTIVRNISIKNNGANTVAISPPQNIIRNNDPGLCSATIPQADIGIATPVGCLEEFTVVHTDFPTGNVFPVGGTIINWTVTDGAGNTASVNQTITVMDIQLPFINCPGNLTVKCASDVPVVDINSVTATDNCSAIVEHVSDVISNQTCANRFTLSRTYKATDPSGNSAVCLQVITVNDDTPPQLTGLSVSKEVLWPPDHKMQDIVVSYTATDNCVSSPIVTITVDSNEPVNGTADGDTDPDWEIIADHHIKLRAERAANGNGRIYTIKITVDDGCNPPVSQSKQVIVAHNITGPQSGKPFKVGSIVAFSGEFWDKPGNTHTAKWLLDGSAVANGSVIEPGGNQKGKVTGSYKFRFPGVYKLQMDITDQSGVTSYANTNEDVDAIVVIYDPNGGHTYGGGYFNSPAGALKADPSATGKASYGFAMNYFKNSTNPKGETQFEFKVGGFEFNALNFDYLVINSSMSQFKGTGKIIGGQSGVGFTMTVMDGQLDGSGIDKIRMKIFNKNNGTIIYDNQFGASDAALPTQAVGANSTVVISEANSSLTKSNKTSQNTQMETIGSKVTTDFDIIGYPNPSINNFSLTVLSNVKEKITMQVVDMYGRVIETRNLSANSITKFGDQYRPGTYFVRIVQGKEHKELKLIKISD